MKTRGERYCRIAGIVLMALAGACSYSYRLENASAKDARVVFPDATINGQPARLILDTGSSMTSLTDTGARRLGIKVLPAPAKATLQVGGAYFPLTMSEPVHLTTQAAGYTAQLPVFSQGKNMWSEGLDGLVGWPEIQDNVLIFNPDQHAIVVVDQAPAETSGWLKLPIVPTYQILYLQITLENGQPGLLLIDTGSDHGVALPPAQWKAWSKTHPQALAVTRTYSSLYGTTTEREAWAQRLTIGPLELTDVPVREADPAEYQNVPDYAGSLGLYALERMDCVVDGKTGFAYLRPRPAPGPAYVGISRPGVEDDVSAQQVWTIEGNLRLKDDDVLAISAMYKNALGDYDGAIAEANQALALDPNNSPACLSRAVAKQNKGDYDGAVADYSRALNLTPQNFDAYLGRAMAKQAAGDNTGAVADYSQALALDPQNAVAYYDRATAEQAAGDNARAIADDTRSLALDPQNANTYLSRGLAQQAAGSDAAALADFTRSLEIDPTNVKTRLNRALLRQEQGDLEGALADLNAAGRSSPQNPDVYRLRGNLRQIQGDFPDAAADYARTIQLRKGAAANARFFLVVVLRRLHRDESRAGLAGALPDWPEGWNKIVGGYLTGHLAEGDFLDEAARPGETTPPGHACEAYYFAGMTHLLNNDAAGAGVFFQKCLGTNATSEPEYDLARAELGRLAAAGKKP